MSALFTIGFTKTTAEHFFDRLVRAGVKRVVDVRLRNSSQLAGFAKAPDLEFFLRAVAGITYQHETILAPTDELLDGFKKGRIGWLEYEQRFRALLHERAVTTVLDRAVFADACLLCSEPTADRCHRRLVAEHFAEHWELDVVHL